MQEEKAEEEFCRASLPSEWHCYTTARSCLRLSVRSVSLTALFNFNMNIVDISYYIAM